MSAIESAPVHRNTSGKQSRFPHAKAQFPDSPSTSRGLAILALMQPDPEVVSAWRASAPFWEKHREIIRQMFAPVTQALVEDGLIGSGNTVLDIATGPGEPALTIAVLVGSECEVFGIDPAPEMVDAARRATEHLGFRNVQFEVASADRLPF